MKKIYQLTVSLILIAVLAAGCKKMDSTYEKFVVKGGIPYTGKATLPKAFAGNNRVKITWLRGTDPNVTKARIFWNNYADSLEIAIPETGDISVIIDNLPEKTYTFQIKTYDDKGTSSVPVELSSGSYGAKYQAQLLNRPLDLVTVNKSGNAVIKWGTADITGGALFSEVSYTDINGLAQIKRFPADEAVSSLSGLKAGSVLQSRTVYRPEALSIDEFFTDYSPVKQYTFDKKDYSIIAFSSQHPGSENAVTNFIDGNIATRWVTTVGGELYPHYATIDLGVTRTITQFSVWRTATDNLGDFAPDKIQFLVSDDKVKWTDMGVFNFRRLEDGEQVFEMPLHPKGRYFKFVAVAGQDLVFVIGEISAYGF